MFNIVRKIFLTISLLSLLLTLFATPFGASDANAQSRRFPLPGSASPTGGSAGPTVDPQITPTSQTPNITLPAQPAQRVANCDVCGFCDGNKPPGRWEACRKCMYPGVGEAAATEKKTLLGVPTPDPFHYYTDLGCISTRPGEFASQITSFFFSIVGGIAFLTFIYGAGVIATARSDPQQLNHGKRIVMGSIIGLLFALFAVFIVNLISSGLGLPL